MSILNAVVNTVFARKSEPLEREAIEAPTLESGQHWCRCCEPGHAWAGAEDVDDYYLACPAYVKHLRAMSTR
jgi:hypothetical protein